MKKASLIKRLFAYLVDWYLTALIITLVITLFTSIQEKNLVVNSKISDLSNTYSLLALILCILLIYCYYLLPYIFTGSFFSIGKHLMHLKIMNIKGSKLELPTLFLRTTLFLFGEQAFNNLAYIFRSYLGNYINNQYILVIYYLSLAISVLSLLMLWRSQNKQMLHDYFAKTIVVEK